MGPSKLTGRTTFGQAFSAFAFTFLAEWNDAPIGFRSGFHLTRILILSQPCRGVGTRHRRVTLKAGSGNPQRHCMGLAYRSPSRSTVARSLPLHALTEPR